MVQILESDPDFRSKLESAGADKIRDGSIASELNFVNHNVRNKLDEIKRQEVERLRHIAKKKFEHVQGIDRQRIKMPDHLHMENAHFAEEDLRKLIKATTRRVPHLLQGGPSALGKRYVDSKFEVAFSSKFIL